MENMRMQALKNMVGKSISEANRKVFDELPPARYAGLVKRYPRLVSYQYISPEVSRFCEDVKTKGGVHVLELYHQYLLLDLMEAALQTNLGAMRLPDEIKRFFHINFERIAGDIEENRNGEGFYLYLNDKFQKDLGVCSLNLIPAGVQKLDLSPLPLSFLFRNGASQFVSRLVYLVTELGGISPLYNQHTDSHDPHGMQEFNPDGWRLTYMRFADIVKMNPEIKGVFGRTWFLDPQLEKISPKLSYVLHINQQNGARIFYLEPSTKGIDDAIYKSAKRRALYEKGEYIPQDYLQIWPRKSLIRWAEQERRLEG